MSNGQTGVRRGTAAVIALWVLGGTAGGQPAETLPAEPALLRADQVVTESHGATERLLYAIEAEAGNDYLITLDQIGLDLILSVEAPDGATRSFDSPLLRDEREFILLEDTVQGRYVVRVESEEHTGAAAAHSIRLTQLTATQGSELEAWRAMTRGAALNAEGGDDSWRASVAAYEAAAEYWRASGRVRELAQALFAAATIEYWELYDWQRSDELAAEAAALYEGLGEATLSANAIHLRAAALVERALETADSSESDGRPSADALFRAAFELLERARRTHEQLGNVYDLGLVLNNFGYTHYNKGEPESARAYWEQAAAVMRSADEWTGELNPTSNLAAVDADDGHVASAIDSFERILDLLPAGTQERYRADTLDNLGISQLMFGNAERALEAFASALSIQSAIDDLQGRGRSLRGLGRSYVGLGQLELAKTYLEEALATARQSNDGRNQEGILRDLGNIAYLEGEYGAALDLHRLALDIVQSASDEAYLQLLVAKDLIALGRGDEALELAERARAAAEGSGSQLLLAEALHQVGRSRLGHADAEHGMGPLERAERVYARLDLQGQHAEVLHSLAAAAKAQGRLERAVEYGAASLDRLEQLRLRVASPELRAFFSSVRREYYEDQIALLMALDSERADDARHSRAALETSERARARMIADLLQEASVDLLFHADAGLRQRQTELYERLAERGAERDRLLAAAEGAGDDREPGLEDVLIEIASIENELDLLEIGLRNASPEFASLSPAEPLDVSRMQSLLDPESVLLQYVFAEQNAYVWVVSRDRVIAVDLGNRAAIEAAARSVLARLEAYSPDRAARSAFDQDLQALADLVLAPLNEHLDALRLVLSLDGVLQYVPFSALPIVHADGSRSRLVERHSVVRVPSMSALAALRRRDDGGRAAKTLAVFADPVLSAADPRLRDGSVLAAAIAEPADTLATRAALRTSLERLPATAYEAEAIAALVPGDQRLVAQGFDASRNAVLGTDLRQYRYVHFATHGVVDSEYPALSGLAMSQFDVTGAPQNGFLRLHDIFGLQLNADLVVLSACETALGREVRGEGLLGLSQGFMYAGARSLIASLWQVPDRATSELMTHFYRFLLGDGLSPAEALRSAQLASAAERRWSDPYFWGGFVLLGDWQ